MAASSANDSSANGQVILNHYVQTPDHIYLSPAFYNKTIGEYKLTHQPETLRPQHNYSGHSSHERLTKMIVSNEQHNRTSLKCQNILLNSTNTSANSIFQLKPDCCDESLSSNGDYSIVDEEEQMNLSVRRNTISAGDDFDMEEEFDEDSNDTRSCSSSSGCSSSSNSMVGSVNRHLSLNNPQYRNPIIATTTTCSVKNGAAIASSPSQYKDLTPKQVKRRFDWDSAPESPMIAKTTVNGKPVSVRTFKLSNAMKQSLVAAGCSKAVAVAAVAAAFKAKDNSSHDKLITSSSPPVTNGNGAKVSIASHQSPTAIAIVNRSPSSPSSSKSPTVHTIVTSNSSPISNGATQSNSTQSQVIFKTPLAPKSSPSPTSIPPTNQQHFYIVNGSGDVSSLETSKPSLKTNGLNVSANGTHLTPILANAVSVNSDSYTNGNDTTAKGSKRIRACNGNANSKNLAYQEPVLASTNGHAHSFNSSVTKTPKMNGTRNRTNSIDSPSNDSNSPCAYSSPFGRDDMSSSSRNYNTSPSPYSPSNSFMDCSSGKSGRTRYETSLGQLTRKFISLLEKSPDGSINLNEASTILQVQKRRIYDITNVLEGVGLLHKTYKNNIQWRGGLFDYCAGKTPEELAEQNSNYRNRKPPPLSLLFSENQDEFNPIGNERPISSPNDIEDELNELENDENRLNDLLEIAHDDLSRIKSDMSSMLYASYMDLRRVPDFAQQTVIGIRPPSDTTLEVPDPSESLQMYLKNARGEMIEVYLCPQISEDDENVPLASDKFQKSTVLNRCGDKAQEDSNSSKNAGLQSNSKSYQHDEFNSSSASEQQFDTNGIKSTSEFESGYNSYFGSSSALGAQSNPHPVESNGQSSNEKNVVISSTYSPNCGSALSGVDIESSLVDSSSVYDDFDSRSINVKSENNQSNSDVGTNFFAHAFISQDDEFGPMGSRSYLTQTEDQFGLKAAAAAHGSNSRTIHSNNHHSTSPIASSLIPLEPPVTEDDYNFTLCENEGIGQLFDDSDFGLSI